MKVGTLWWDECPYKKKTDFSVSTPMRWRKATWTYSEKVTFYKLGRQLYLESYLPTSWSLTFPASRTVRNTCWLFKLLSLWYFFKQPELTRTPVYKASWGTCLYDIPNRIHVLLIWLRDDQTWDRWLALSATTSNIRGSYETAGWHHQLEGCEFKWTPGAGDGQGGLVWCDSWGHKELDTTERLNWAELNCLTSHCLLEGWFFNWIE